MWRRKAATSPAQKSLFDLLNLHPAAEGFKYNDKAVLEAVRREPKAARKKYVFKACYCGELYPLSMAVALGASLKVVRLLYLAFPDAIKHIEPGVYGGKTALHFACIRNPSLQVVQFLVDQYPSAMQIKDAHGRTPLHCACTTAPAVLVAMLAERCPDVMDIENDHGNTPLTLAKEQASEKVSAVLTTLHTLLLANPGADKVISMLVGWSGGMWSSQVAPVLHHRTSVVQRLDINYTLMPPFLERVSREGRLQTMFGVVRETMELFDCMGEGLQIRPMASKRRAHRRRQSIMKLLDKVNAHRKGREFNVPNGYASLQC